MPKTEDRHESRQRMKPRPCEKAKVNNVVPIQGYSNDATPALHQVSQGVSAGVAAIPCKSEADGVSPLSLCEFGVGAYIEGPHGGLIMKLALIALGLLGTTGVVYAACLFC
jgi:hypothetical protein